MIFDFHLSSLNISIISCNLFGFSAYCNPYDVDFLATFKDWDYSVSDIVKNSGVSFKTALNEIKNLEQQDVVSRTRTVGKAIMYKLNLDSKQGFHIDKLVFELATKRVLESETKNKTKVRA